MITHNMMNYDLHHIIKSSHSASTKISQPQQKLKLYQSMMKFISLNFGFFIETRNCIQDEVAVKSTFALLTVPNSRLFSLDKLVQSLTDTKFSLLDNFYRGNTDDEQKLLMKEGDFAYSYVDSFSKLGDLSLPSLKNRENSLKNNKNDLN